MWGEAIKQENDLLTFLLFNLEEFHGEIVPLGNQILVFFLKLRHFTYLGAQLHCNAPEIRLYVQEPGLTVVI